MKTEETTVKGFRLKTRTLLELDKIAEKQQRKLNNLVSIILESYVRGQKSKK